MSDGLLIAALTITEYRFLVLEHSAGIDGGVIAPAVCRPHALHAAVM